MKTSVSIPDPVYRSAETLARRLKISRSQLYSIALAEYVAMHRKDQITKRLDAVYSNLDQGIDTECLALQIESLPDENW